MSAIKPHPSKETGVLIVQWPSTGATFQTSGMPGTTPYTEDSALAYAFPATTTVHFHSIVAVVSRNIGTRFFNICHIIIVCVDVVVV